MSLPICPLRPRRTVRYPLPEASATDGALAMLRKRTSPASRSTPTSEARPCELLLTILRDRSVPVLRPHTSRLPGEVRRKAAAQISAAPAASAAHILAPAQGVMATATLPRLRPDAHPHPVVLQDRSRLLHRPPRPGDHQPGRRHRAELQYQHRGDDRHDPRGPPRIGDRVSRQLNKTLPTAFPHVV